MSFQPVVPFGGLAGWAFLQRTQDTQQAAFDRSPARQRDTDRFIERIGSVTSAAELVSDRRLLAVTLGAFGLDDDIDNRFFIRKVLEDGPTAPDALANRLADKRYAALADAFRFDLAPPNTVLSDFGPRIVAAYRDRQFEIAVGAQSSDMRLALGLERELSNLTGRSLSEDGLWFTVMATPPLRKVFEAALNLPATLGTLDIDRQLGVFKDRTRAFFGEESLRQFSDPDKQATLLRRFLLASESTAAPTAAAPGATALALLQATQPLAIGSRFAGLLA
ncbi:DUF1217 domain-containing protein [Palleronia sp. KMU-117]|uniref:DUF1217 domain-containing protein n=1 Tax=Palleronia sp. KMU-117 TaxID=3434108 RepID=UPI003D73A81E